jgi:hypothetical protein
MSRSWSLLSIAIVAFPTPSPGQTPLDVIRLLSGQWRGSGVELLIDTERQQGNTNSRKPFERQPLVIKNITGSMVVFNIGKENFIALVKPDTMVVTRPGESSSITLTRIH